LENTQSVSTAFERQRYIWRIRLSVWGASLVNLFQELRKRPLALLGGFIIILYILVAIFASAITVHHPVRGELRDRLTPPAWIEGGDWQYPLGTDGQGRDILTRIIYGSQVSLMVGLLSVGVSAGVGVLLGSITGYFRGWLDDWISRFAELLMAFPYLIFAIGVMAFLGPGFTNLILALTFKGWVEFFRLVRGEMMAQKTQEYVEAARVSGEGDAGIIIREILPNIFQSVFVLSTLRIGYMIIMEASLSFLGLGLPPSVPAWGSMVAAGRDYMLNAWWVATMPGIAIVILVLAINLFGEGLRDILDPRLKVE
jgi:peptide/nickel transport system permease protein